MRVLFGDVTSGRLGRLGYLGWSLLLGAVLIGGLVALLVAVAGMEQLASGRLDDAPAALWERLGPPVVLALLAVGACLTFASFNVTAKRVRDMGLPGWRALLVAALVLAAVGAAAGEQAASGLNLLGGLALLLVPSQGFGPRL